MKIRDILREFAPDSGGDGDDGFSEETLKRLAAAWYNGDEDPRVEQTLMAAGWEIGQDEGYDDEPGVFVVQAGDVNGHSFISWPANELRQGVAEGLEEDAARAEAQADYMQGQCMILAVAINQLNPKRYPIGYIWEYNMSAGAPDMQLDDDEWEYLSPQEQEKISKDISRHSVVHAYVRDQETGEYIDARGRHKTLPNLWGRMGQTRFVEFPGTARELIDITAHGDWDEVGEKVDFKRGQPAFDSLAGPAGVKRAQDYAVKYLGVEGSKNKAPGTDQQGVSEGQRR